ncbi:MAG: hypothetical protein F6K24_14020 [Okeania sp. SIO2D1]|nr:hypothetical protein [Okeania sp. SIO2D1]
MPPEQLQILNKTKVLDYYFVQPLEYATTKKIKGYFVLGLASLCNHAKDPNYYVEWIEDEVDRLYTFYILYKNLRLQTDVCIQNYRTQQSSFRQWLLSFSKC